MTIRWLLFFASCFFHHYVGDNYGDYGGDDDNYGNDGDDDVWHELNRG